MARQGKLVVPKVSGAEFSAPVAAAQAVDTAVATAPINLIIGPVTVRLHAATPTARILFPLGEAVVRRVIFRRIRSGRYHHPLKFTLQHSHANQTAWLTEDYTWANHSEIAPRRVDTWHLDDEFPQTPRSSLAIKHLMTRFCVTYQ